MTTAEITVTIPADSRFIAMARVTAASLGAELGFSIDDLEELRTGANELVALLVEWAQDHGAATVDLRYELADGSLEMHASADAASESSTEPLDPLTRQILDAVTDSWELDGGRGVIRKRPS